MASISFGCISCISKGEPALLAHSATFGLTHANMRMARISCGSSKAAAAGNREPRGIMKPKPISLAMQELLGVPEIARTQALKQIWAYIKHHNLQDPENKKVIVCDEKLKKIFGGKDRVGFLEISGLINPHFL